MKRIISVFLALVFVFSLTGCTSLIPSPNSEIADKSASVRGTGSFCQGDGFLSVRGTGSLTTSIF